MSSLDLVQLRWQHIRTLEAYQLLQRENQSLREENEKLKARPPITVADTTDATKAKDLLIKQQHEKMLKMITHLQTYCIKIKRDYSSLQVALTKELNDCHISLPILYQVQNKYISLLAEKQMEINTVKLEKHECDKKLFELQQKLDKLHDQNSDEVDKLKTINQQCKQEIKSLQANKTLIENNCKVLELQITGLQSENKQFDAKQQVIYAIHTLFSPFLSPFSTHFPPSYLYIGME